MNMRASCSGEELKHGEELTLVEEPGSEDPPSDVVVEVRVVRGRREAGG